MMSLACLVYIAQLDPDADKICLQQYNDLNTRANAKARITGVLMIAGGFLFEIIEGEYSTLESNLDRVSGSGIIEDPEILIFTALKKHQFTTWKMGIIDSEMPDSQDLSVYRILGAQTQSDASSTPGAALRMLKEFHAQFAHTGTNADAA